MEAPSPSAQASNSDRTLDFQSFSSNREREIVEAVACPSHLSHEHLSQRGTLVDQRQDHHPCGEKLLDPIAAYQTGSLHELSSHQSRRAYIFQQKADFQKDFSKS